MAIPILHFWKNYFSNPDEGLGSSYERIIIHNKILNICQKLGVSSLLEAPSFGFTGTSGINSLGFAKNDIDVSLVDDNPERIELIKKVWQQSNAELNAQYVKNFEELPFEDNSFDISWNFSALWFVNDLHKFLAELARVSKKAVILAVPNRTGIGYLNQKYTGKNDLAKYLTEDFIKEQNFIPIMKNLGFDLVEWNYFDCPPWPDIGMHKERFLKKMGLGFLVKKQKKPQKPLTVLDYWQNKDLNFANNMLKFYWLEKFAPKLFKKFWAHHKYYLFVKK